MGCNCKNKNTEMAKKVKTQVVNNEVVITNQEAPPYTMEEIIQVKDFLNSKTKTADGMRIALEFNQKYFGETPVGYCDQPCMERIRKRIELASQRIIEYNNLKK